VQQHPIEAHSELQREIQTSSAQLDDALAYLRELIRNEQAATARRHVLQREHELIADALDLQLGGIGQKVSRGLLSRDLRRQNAELRAHLHNFFAKYYPPPEVAEAGDEEAAAVDEEQRPSSKRRRRQPGGGAADGGEGTSGRKAKQRRLDESGADAGFMPGMWSLEKLVMALLESYLGTGTGTGTGTGGAGAAEEEESYLLLDAAKHWPRYVEILEQSGVLERHPSDDRRVRMVRFAA